LSREYGFCPEGPARIATRSVAGRAFGTSLPQNQKAGQKLSWIPVHIFEATSAFRIEQEDEDEREKILAK
jgi:hypothetical protein